MVYHPLNVSIRLVRVSRTAVRKDLSTETEGETGRVQSGLDGAEVSCSIGHVQKHGMIMIMVGHRVEEQSWT